MKVWKITQNGMGNYLILDSMDEFEHYQGKPKDFNVGDKFTFEVIEMSDKDFRNLPEFEYFE